MKNYAILIDGSFLTKRIQELKKRVATADDVIALCNVIREYYAKQNFDLLRIYFYNAPPASDSLRTPIEGEKRNLAESERFKASQALHDRLETQEHFALRMGEVVMPDKPWRLKQRAITRLLNLQKIRAEQPGASLEELERAYEGKLPSGILKDSDFEIDLRQKGVDMRIGMDLALLSLRHKVHTVVIVTADGDFVPALKFCRREAVRVALCSLGHSINRALKVHSDYQLDIKIPTDRSSG